MKVSTFSEIRAGRNYSRSKSKTAFTRRSILTFNSCSSQNPLLTLIRYHCILLFYFVSFSHNLRHLRRLQPECFSAGREETKLSVDIAYNAYCSRYVYLQQRKNYRSVILAAKDILESFDWSKITRSFLLRHFKPKSSIISALIILVGVHQAKKELGTGRIK